MEMMILPDIGALVEAAAQRIVQTIQQCFSEHQWCALALSGGSTPRPVYERLSQSPYREAVHWTHVHWFWGDERAVPPDHPDSNYRMASEALLRRLALSPDHIHRIPAEMGVEAAAEAYEEEIRRVFHLDRGAIPQFDLLLLGVGADGHIASLFPHSQALQVRNRLVVANRVPQLATPRITLTPPVIQAARTIIVLVSGAEKAAAVARALEGPEDWETTPAQLLRTAQGTVIWMLDKAAAGQLSP